MTFSSPVGPISVVTTPSGVRRLVFGEFEETIDSCEESRSIAERACAQLREYFDGTRRAFDLPLDPGDVGTEFQQRVWRVVETIAFGETTSYGEIAEQVASAGSSRAVGAANGANPLPIFVPCHRVLGADGSLTGYAGGVEIKRWLLEHERALPRREGLFEGEAQEDIAG